MSSEKSKVLGEVGDVTDYVTIQGPLRGTLDRSPRCLQRPMAVLIFCTSGAHKYQVSADLIFVCPRGTKYQQEPVFLAPCVACCVV